MNAAPANELYAPDTESGSSAEQRLAYAAVCVIVLLASLLRILPLTYSHFWDEAVFLQHAKVMLDGRINYDEFMHRPPFLSVIYAAGFAVWDCIYVANVVQGIVTGLGVLFGFLYVRRTFGLMAGVFTALLLAFLPYLVEASHDLLTDGPALTLMLLAMWLFDKPGERSAALSGVAYSLAIQTRYTSIFLVVYFVLDAIIAPRKLRQLILMGAAAALALTPYLIWNQWTFGSMLHPFLLARRIVTEWTAPVPALFYRDAIIEIFPVSVWVLFGIGIIVPLATRMRHQLADGVPTDTHAVRHANKRLFVLLAWGGAFFLYMLSTPHKEVRYLLPLVMPALIVSAVGASALVGFIRHQGMTLRVAALLLACIIATMDYGSVFSRLRAPLVNRWESPEVQIARFLAAHSTAAETVYAAHNFPVFAYYSARPTVSLLPIQDSFDEDWREVMDKPGLLVYAHPERIGEIHSVNPELKPDRVFLESHLEFTVARVFPTATVYRYTPAPPP